MVAANGISDPSGSDDLLYVYGVCRKPDPSLSLPLGLEQETALVIVDQLAAIFEAGIDVKAIQADDQRLLTAVLSHDRVICDLFNQLPILPMRFGTQLGSLGQLRDHLLTHYTNYLTKLDRLAAKAEYQIKLVPIPILPMALSEGLKGRDYFLAKKQRLQDQTGQQQQQQQDLEEFLSSLYATYPDCVQLTSPDGDTKIYLLLTPPDLPHLKQQAQAWLAHTRHWQLSLSEALPPYHFV